MAFFSAGGKKERRSKADFAPTLVRVTGFEPAAGRRGASAGRQRRMARAFGAKRPLVHTIQQKRSTCVLRKCSLGPSDWIRTSGLLNPIQADVPQQRHRGTTEKPRLKSRKALIRLDFYTLIVPHCRQNYNHFLCEAERKSAQIFKACALFVRSVTNSFLFLKDIIQVIHVISCFISIIINSCFYLFKTSGWV